ncbi:MAG TPA: hypothetical protein VFS59_12625 [Gemmatimonadaceae bacterium]|nr:hypothetical protein [Gemmatimonadaceae bacterium]
MRDGAGDGRASWLWSACLLPFLVLVVARWRQLPSITEGDYAQYYLHATALLQGRPYGDIGYIYTQYNPWLGPPTQPPGWPLTLVPLLAAVGPNMFAIKLLLVFMGVFLLVLAGMRIASSNGRAAAGAAVLMTGVALEAMNASHSAISDLGFCAFAWAVILAADRPGAWTAKRIALVTMLGLGVLSYRTAGAALIPAMLLFAVVRREGWRPVVPVVIWVLAGVVVLLKFRVGVTVLSAIPTSMDGVLFSVKASARTYGVQGVSELLLYPFPWRLANIAYHAAALPLLGWGLARSLWRERRTLMTSFFVVYVVMLIVVPVREERYLWPVMPIMALGFFDGLRALLALRLPTAAAERATLASCGVLATAAMCVVLLRPPRETLFQHPEVRALFARIAALPRTPTPRVVFVNPHVLTWETGVAAMPSFHATTTQAMAEMRRRRITHVVLGDLGVAPRLDSVLRRAVADSVQAFSPLYRDSVFQLFALRAPDTVGAAPVSNGTERAGAAR